MSRNDYISTNGSLNLDTIFNNIDNHTSQLADIATQGISVLSYNAKGDYNGNIVTNDTQAFINATTDANIKNIPLIIPCGNYYIDGHIEIKTDVICYGTIIMPNNGTGSIEIVRDSIPIILTSSNLTNLLRGSTNIGGLGDKLGTLLLESTEIMIERTTAVPYTKADVCEVTEVNGDFLPALDQTYSDLTKLTATLYPTEKPLSIYGLTIKLIGDAVATRDHTLGVYRSDVTFYGFNIETDSILANPQIGVRIQNATNVKFESPIIKGINSSASGYGIAIFNSAFVYINNAKMTDCRHGISGRCNKQVFINGGFYVNAVIDSHWGNGFYIDGITETVGIAYTHIIFAGTDITVRNSKFYGGLNIVGIRDDTPELQGKLIIENIKWKTTAPLARITGFSATTLLTFTFSKTLNNPELTIIKDVIIDIPDTSTVVGIVIVGRQYAQNYWGDIFIENIKVDNAYLRAIDADKNVTYYINAKNTKVIIEDITFPRDGAGGSMSITDFSPSSINTHGFDVTINRCRNFFWSASESACIKVLIKDCTITNIWRITSGYGFIGTFVLNNCILNNVLFTGNMLIDFKNCVFSGAITSNNTAIDARTISSYGNLAKVGTTGQPTNLDNYKNATYYI